MGNWDTSDFTQILIRAISIYIITFANLAKQLVRRLVRIGRVSRILSHASENGTDRLDRPRYFRRATNPELITILNMLLDKEPICDRSKSGRNFRRYYYGIAHCAMRIVVFRDIFIFILIRLSRSAIGAE